MPCATRTAPFFGGWRRLIGLHRLQPVLLQIFGLLCVRHASVMIALRDLRKMRSDRSPGPRFCRSCAQPRSRRWWRQWSATKPIIGAAILPEEIAEIFDLQDLDGLSSVGDLKDDIRRPHLAVGRVLARRAIRGKTFTARAFSAAWSTPALRRPDPLQGTADTENSAYSVTLAPAQR